MIWYNLSAPTPSPPRKIIVAINPEECMNMVFHFAGGSLKTLTEIWLRGCYCTNLTNVVRSLLEKAKLFQVTFRCQLEESQQLGTIE